VLPRRQFIRTGTAAAIAIASPALRAATLEDVRRAFQSAGPRSPEDVAADERVWKAVQDSFAINRNVVNLVSVVRGIAPEVVRDAWVTSYDNANRWTTVGQAPVVTKAQVRSKLAAFINADPAEVAITRNTTEGMTTVVMGHPLSRGDEILTTTQEHAPFYGMLQQRAARDGVGVRTIPLPAPATSLPALVDAVDRAMTSRTRLVALCHVPLHGQINPIRAIADRVHARGARLLVDGALAVAHARVDVKALDCDYYAANLHKWGSGPPASGILYIKRPLIASIPPLFGSVLFDGAQPRSRAGGDAIDRFEAFGQHPAANIAGLNALMDFLDAIGMANLEARLRYLATYWLRRVPEVPGFRMATLDTAEHRCSLTAWELEGRDRRAVGAALRARGVYVGSSDPYAGFFGIPLERPRALTISNTAMFTRLDELDRFVDTLKAVARS
jgi:selenocysteine lyase/cysteine desulfurase